jgi:sulfopyruvate decarboxylase subunit beta
VLSVGGFPTATGAGTSLAGVAAAAGVPHAVEVRTVDAFVAAFAAARAAGALTTIVAKVDAVGPAVFVTDLGLLENRFQFQRYLRSR